MVLIASPIAGVRSQWSEGLEDRFPLYEVAERASLERSMTNLKPTILILDLALPGLGGVEGTPAIQRLSPVTSIILMTSTSNEREGLAALKAGARGWALSPAGSSPSTRSIASPIPAAG